MNDDTMNARADMPPWKLITGEQLKQGWMELRGVTPVHHDYIVLEMIEAGHDGGRPVYRVRNPELQMLESSFYGARGRRP